MGKLIVTAVLLLILYFLHSARGQQETIKKEVKEYFDQYFKALKSRNLTRIMQFWPEDAVRMPPGMFPVKGKEAISKFIAQVLAGIGPFNIRQTIDDVGEEGNIIYARTHLKVIEIGKGVKTYRKFLFLLKRRIDGGLKFFISINNHNPGPQ